MIKLSARALTGAYIPLLVFGIVVLLAANFAQAADAADTASINTTKPSPCAAITNAKDLFDTPIRRECLCLTYTNPERSDFTSAHRFITHVDSKHSYSEIKTLSEKLLQFPHDAQYLEDRAKEYFVNGCPLLAMSDAEKAIEENPFSHSAHVIKLLCMVQLGRSKESVEELKLALASFHESEPDEMDYALENSYSSVKIKTTTELAPVLDLAYREGDLFAIQQLEDKFSLALAHDIDKCFADYNWSQAALKLDAMNEIDSASALQKMQSGICFLRLHKPETAERYCSRGCLLAPKEPLCHLLNGLALKQLGHSNDALREEELAYELADKWTAPYDVNQAKIGNEAKLTFAKCFTFIDQPEGKNDPDGDRQFFEDEKCLLRFFLTCVIKRAPGLVLNAGHGHPIKLIARKCRDTPDILALAYPDTIVFGDGNVILHSRTDKRSFDYQEYYYGSCFHELAHLCSYNLLSGSQEWLDIVNPLAKAYSKADQMAQEKNARAGEWLCFQKVCPVFVKPELFALPSSYAATNPEECLAECADSVICNFEAKANKEPSKEYAKYVPLIKQFIEQKLLSYPQASAIDQSINIKRFALDKKVTLTEPQISMLLTEVEHTATNWQLLHSLIKASKEMDGRIPPLVAKALNQTRHNGYPLDQERSLELKSELAALFLRSNKPDEALREVEELAAMEHLDSATAEVAISTAMVFNECELVKKLYSKVKDAHELSTNAKLTCAEAVYCSSGIEATMWFLKRGAFEEKKELVGTGDDSALNAEIKNYLQNLACAPEGLDEIRALVVGEAFQKLGDKTQSRHFKKIAAELNLFNRHAQTIIVDDSCNKHN